MIKNVTIVGGTHGNERTGIVLVNYLKQKWPRYKGINLTYLLSNQHAIEQNRRYIDQDLNRSFQQSMLDETSTHCYEIQKAQEIEQLFHTGYLKRSESIIDLHTTTSNMGVTLILLEQNYFTLGLSLYLKEHIPNLYIYDITAINRTKPQCDHPYLCGLSSYGFVIEVGPIANGIIRDDILQQTQSAVEHSLDFIASYDPNNTQLPNTTLTLYRYVEPVFYPRYTDPSVTAYIHENLQDQDYQPLTFGDPIFKTLDNQTLCFDKKETYYPVFINEAAYYDQNIAFYLTQKTILQLRDVVPMT